MSRRTKGRTIAFVAILVAGSIASLAAPPGSLVLSLRDITCQSCGHSVVAMLERQPGIMGASFDRDSAEIEVELGDGAPSADELVELIHQAGYEAKVGAGLGSYAPSIEFEDGLDVEWLSRAGEAVPIEDHLEAGKVTVFDFYATWCGPCREVDEEMRRILAEHDDVSLKKLNIVDWDSPIAKQELGRVSGLPYVEVYGRDGKRVAAISGLDLKRLNRAIEKGRTR